MSQPASNRRAVLYAVGAAVLGPSLPLAVAVSPAGEFPLVFSAVSAVCLAVGVGALAWRIRPRPVRWRMLAAAMAGRWQTRQSLVDRWSFAGAAGGRLGFFVCFALSVRYTHPAIATAVAYTSVLWMMCYKHADGATGGRHRFVLKPSIVVLLAVLLMSGLALTQASASTDLQLSNFWSVGVVLALAASLFDAANLERGMKFGEIFANQIRTGDGVRSRLDENTEVFYTAAVVSAAAAATAAACFAAVAVLPSVSFVGFSDYFSDSGALLTVALILVAGSYETYLIRRLNSATHTLETNWLIYIGAVITLPVLVALPLDDKIARLDFYTVGAAMIMAAIVFANMGRKQPRFVLH